MLKHNATNERIKRRYLIFLKEAKRYSEQSVDSFAKAIHLYEVFTKFREFKSFHYEQAIEFKKHLSVQKAAKSDRPLSKSTLYATFNNLKRFFQWLSQQQGYKSSIQYSDAEYFNLSEKEVRIATAKRQPRFPTIEQVKHVIQSMPAKTEVEKRDRAVVAFVLLTGCRDGAIASLKLRHVDLHQGLVDQDAREVNTKGSKSFVSYFFPVGQDILDIVTEWVHFLRTEKLWGNDDPLFPATAVRVGKSRQFEANGLSRHHWSNSTSIRKIFRESFEGAGLTYFNPHSLRKTLVNFGEKICQSPEEFKAWSQNLGHEQVLTTFLSYGEVATQRQGEIIQHLKHPQRDIQNDHLDKLVEAVMRKIGNCQPVTPPSQA